MSYGSKSGMTGVQEILGPHCGYGSGISGPGSCTWGQLRDSVAVESGEGSNMPSLGEPDGMCGHGEGAGRR